MREPCKYEPAPYSPLKPTDAAVALPIVVANNQCARQNRDTLVELQQWVRGRAP